MIAPPSVAEPLAPVNLIILVVPPLSAKYADVSGNVIGIISLKIVQDEVEGMGFAIPINDALKYASLIEEGGEISRPYLGIGMLDLSEEYYLWQNRITIPDGVDEGVAVISVEKNTPAEKARYYC